MKIFEKNRNQSQRGAMAIEYALIAALMVLAIIPTLEVLSGETNGLFTMVGTKLNAAMQQAR
jgi:Flp pilus assembly pilin Flp